MPKLKCLLFCLLLILSNNPYSAFAQETVPETKIIERLNELDPGTALESVYLQTSKDIYETGEDLWFSAVVLERQSLVPSQLSKTLYVQLNSDRSDVPVKQEMFELKDGFAEGHLLIPDSLKTSNYWLAAFTANSLTNPDEPMKSVRRIKIREDIIPNILIAVNFDEESYPSQQSISGTVRFVTPSGTRVSSAKATVGLKRGNKTLERIKATADTMGVLKFGFSETLVSGNEKVVVQVDHEGKDETLTVNVPQSIKNLQLNFLPEGGHLITGMTNRVAFKAVQPSGLPQQIDKATLFADGSPLLDFSSEHAGMGSFNLFVNSDVKYTVKVSEPRIDSTYTLPISVEEGVQVRVLSKSQNAIDLGISKSPTFELDSAVVAMKQKGKVVWLAAVKLNDEGFRIPVPTSGLAMGIVQVGLYTDRLEPLSERLVFVNHHKQLKATTTLDASQYTIKEKAEVKLKVTDNDGQPVQSVFTMSIVDELYHDPEVQNDQIAHFLLSDDLKGSIHKPSYYFEEGNPKAEEHLDLLMLTQGWRSYEWTLTKAKQPNEPIQIPDHVLGQINLRTVSGKAKREGKYEVQLVGGFGVALLNVDSTGSFFIDPLYLTGGSRLMVNVADQKFAEVDFTSGFHVTGDQLGTSNFIDHYHAINESTSRNWSKLPQSQAGVRELDEVQVFGTRTRQEKVYGRDGAMFNGRNSDYVCMYNILNCGNHRHGTKPRDGQLYRTNGGLFVRYNAPDLIERSVITVEGYYSNPQFYEPNYDAKPDEKLLPDYRNTLLWKANVVTDEKGEATFSFYTSDIRAVFMGKVEMLGANGQFGVHRFNIDVLK